MTSRISKLVLAAVVAASLPAVAAASDCDHRPAHAAWPAPHRAEPARWRESERREHLLQRIHAELRALDAERAAFHARHARHPGKLRRYDRQWAERRAEVERRHWQLERIAWR